MNLNISSSKILKGTCQSPELFKNFYFGESIYLFVSLPLCLFVAKMAASVEAGDLRAGMGQGRMCEVLINCGTLTDRLLAIFLLFGVGSSRERPGALHGEHWL